MIKIEKIENKMRVEIQGSTFDTLYEFQTILGIVYKKLRKRYPEELANELFHSTIADGFENAKKEAVNVSSKDFMEKGIDEEIGDALAALKELVKSEKPSR